MRALIPAALGVAAGLVANHYYGFNLLEDPKGWVYIASVLLAYLAGMKR